MKQKVITLLTLCICFVSVTSQEIDITDLSDYEFFIEKLNNSQDEIYYQVIEKYDEYLSQHPEDVLIEIQKCKFVQYAQYDEYDDYNPNQTYFDSCKLKLEQKSPYHPAVLLFLTTCTWGDELQVVFDKANESITNYPKNWSSDQLGAMYFEMGLQNYYDEEYVLANKMIGKACTYDYLFSQRVEYAETLINIGKEEEAIALLLVGLDTTASAWELNQKADLLLQLEKYEEALKVYDLISQMDSNYSNKGELAEVMTGIGEYDKAREYLVADTAAYWQKEIALLKLFLHDVKHSSSDTALNSYTDFRDLGYSTDPLAIYRFKLFFSHPFLSWEFRDLLGVLTMVLLLILLIIVPSIWILPVYFIGHKFKIINQEKIKDSIWGLDSFWWVSTGYLVATFIALLVVPGEFIALVTDSGYATDSITDDLGVTTLVFLIAFACFALVTLVKVDLKSVIARKWSIGHVIKTTIGLFILFKIGSVIYIRIGVAIFDIDLNELLVISQVLLSSKPEILALISTYGNWTAILMIAFVVPVYEEVVFRGVILESAKRYLNFNWANVLQSFIFASIHMDLFMFPIFFGFGMITGQLQKKSGGLLGGILFHMANNLLAILVIIARS